MNRISERMPEGIVIWSRRLDEAAKTLTFQLYREGLRIFGCVQVSLMEVPEGKPISGESQDLTLSGGDGDGFAPAETLPYQIMSMSFVSDFNDGLYAERKKLVDEVDVIVKDVLSHGFEK